MPPVEKPNYTQIPNVILDSMPDMTSAEFCVVMAICRQTFGWHKKGEKLSLTQLQALTGLGRHAVMDALESALAHGWISRKPAGQTFYYRVNVLEVAARKQHQSQEVAARKQHQSQNSTGAKTAPVTGAKTAPVLARKQHRLDADSPEVAALPKESFKETIKEKTVAAATARPNEFAIYETEIGVLTPAIADQLKADLEEYPAGWLVDAIRTAALANVRKYSYVRAILSRWHKEGRGRQQTPSSNGHKPADDPTFGGFVVPIIPLEDTP